MMQPGNAEVFKQSFREEARDLLADLESALLELHEHPSDPELVGRIFRGLHTIKGSGRMFGFERLASFAHDLETAFDRVRNGHLAVTAELVDLSLRAIDQFGVMLEEDGGAADTQGAAAILEGVRRLAGLSETLPAAVQEPPQVEAETRQCRTWKIYFAPGPDLLRTGANPLLLVRELSSLGDASVRACAEAIPPVGELDPERCYVSWEITLTTSAGADAIRDIFIFVEDACELSIAQQEEGARETTECPDASEAERIARGLDDQRSPTGGRRHYDKPDTVSSLRVAAGKLDQFVNLVGELVTVQARLSELAGGRDDAEVTAVSEEIERLTSALRESSMNLRMIPIRSTFEKFRRLVHDLARELGKNVELTIDGADTELDKTVIDQLGDPLMHLIRNSMDHGIEAAADLRRQDRRADRTHLQGRSRKDEGGRQQRRGCAAGAGQGSRPPDRRFARRSSR